MTTFEYIVVLSLLANIFIGIYEKNWHSSLGWFVALLYFVAQVGRA